MGPRRRAASKGSRSLPCAKRMCQMPRSNKMIRFGHDRESAPCAMHWCLGERRNFARAAEALGLTQPTLSRSIAALERDLGVKLFERSHKGARSTVFGRVLLERGAIRARAEPSAPRDPAARRLEAGSLTSVPARTLPRAWWPPHRSRGVAHPGLRISATPPPTEVVRNRASPRRPTWASPRPPSLPRNRC